MVFMPVEEKRGQLPYLGPQRPPITQHTAVPAPGLERVPVVGQVAPGTLTIVTSRESENLDRVALRGEVPIPNSAELLIPQVNSRNMEPHLNQMNITPPTMNITPPP